jgi:hypothetical protein
MHAKRGGKARAKQTSFDRDFERGRKIAAKRNRIRGAKMRDDKARAQNPLAIPEHRLRRRLLPLG